jgi:hypothetical protein
MKTFVELARFDYVFYAEVRSIFQQKSMPEYIA